MNPSFCSVCDFRANSFELIIKHVIKYHKSEPNFKITCKFRGCGATFIKWGSFKKHVLRNHPLRSNVLNEFNIDKQQEQFNEDEEENAGIQITTEFDEIQSRFAHFLINIRETYRTSSAALTEITSGLEDFLEYFSGTLLGEIRQHTDLNTGLISLQSINQIFEQLKPSNVISTVSSKYLLDKFLEQKFHMLPPQKIKIGISYKWIRTKIPPFSDLVDVEDTAVIVPFLESLTNLLKNDQVLFNIENPRNDENGLLRTVLDGSYYKNNEFFKNNENSLAIILYVDEIGIANPLGANSKKQKLYMFYWTLGNLYSEFRSSQDAIQLLGIVRSNIVKKHGLVKVLEPFVKDVRILQTEGIRIFHNNEEKIFKGSLLFGAGDTPASAELGGFKESVSATRPCRTCFTDDKEWKTNFNEKKFTLRDATSHRNHVEAVTESNVTKRIINFWKTRYGVNGPSPLDGIPHLDITKCLPQDIMHILILGAVDIEIRALLSYLIIDLQLFTVGDLNSRIEAFDFDHFRVNKPGCIVFEQLTENKSLKQSASQMFGLVHCLPFLIAEWTLSDDRQGVKDRILCHSRLLQILNLCCSYEIHVDTVDLLSHMIDIFITEFNQLYPNKIVPKFHFLVHIPLYIKLFGPARQQWCFRFEATHNFSKCLVPVVRNFKNMPYTLAYRYQARMSSRLATLSDMKSKKFLDQGVNISAGHSVLLENLPNANLLYNYVQEGDRDVEIMRTKEINLYGTTYKPNNVFLLESSDELLPIFARIVEIFVVHENVIIIYNILNTLCYKEEFNAYQIQKPQVFSQFAISIKNLIFPHPIPVLKFRQNLYALLLDNERNEFYG